jgi:hypothetical protein
MPSVEGVKDHTDSTSTASTVMNRSMYTFNVIRLSAQFWLEPVALSKNYDFSPRELNAIRQIISSNRITFLEASNEHCG